eukprot:Tbor_TRINITY_DN2864_c0_g1::TRINITY_DN2864_c0_g1_i1::g.23220::m.23220
MGSGRGVLPQTRRGRVCMMLVIFVVLALVKNQVLHNAIIEDNFSSFSDNCPGRSCLPSKRHVDDGERFTPRDHRFHEILRPYNSIYDYSMFTVTHSRGSKGSRRRSGTDTSNTKKKSTRSGVNPVNVHSFDPNSQKKQTTQTNKPRPHRFSSAGSVFGTSYDQVPGQLLVLPVYIALAFISDNCRDPFGAVPGRTDGDVGLLHWTFILEQIMVLPIVMIVFHCLPCRCISITSLLLLFVVRGWCGAGISRFIPQHLTRNAEPSLQKILKGGPLLHNKQQLQLRNQQGKVNTSSEDASNCIRDLIPLLNTAIIILTLAVS